MREALACGTPVVGFATGGHPRGVRRGSYGAHWRKKTVIRELRTDTRKCWTTMRRNERAEKMSAKLPEASL